MHYLKPSNDGSSTAHFTKPSEVECSDVHLDRYFIGKDAPKSSRKKIPRHGLTRLSDPKTDANLNSDAGEKVIPSRPKLGLLPSFIPIERDDSTVAIAESQQNVRETTFDPQK